MFGKRPDATLVTGLSTMRSFMPFISPRRNDSLVLYAQHIEADAAIAFVERYNETAPEDRKLTLFHLLVRALALTFHRRPGINRFIAGGRIWQRNDVWATFSAKVELRDRSPLVTVKRRFPEDESLEDMVGDILGRLGRRRGGEKTQSDQEMNFALRLPPFLIRMGVWLLHQANQLGALPRKMIDDDPLFTSIFIANLGSVDMESAYHHLWEYGTASHFAMMGRVSERPDGTHYFEVRYSYDERVNDGLYGGLSMQVVKDLIEHPEKLA